MSFSENLSSLRDMAAGYAMIAKKKAGIVASIAKMNVAMFAEEDKIKKAEAELGRMYYNDFVSGNLADTEAYLPVCNRITGSKSTVASIKEEIARLKSELNEESAAEADEVTDADFEVNAEEEPAEEEPEEASEE